MPYRDNIILAAACAITIICCMKLLKKKNMDPYAQVAKGKLKLKGDGGIKKKKKNKDKKILEQVSRTAETEENQQQQQKPESKRTKAEIAFQKMQEKMQTERILDKASMTHKERVEKFNQHLDGLTEHFDIPKVSWTK